MISSNFTTYRFNHERRMLENALYAVVQSDGLMFTEYSVGQPIGSFTVLTEYYHTLLLLTIYTHT